jgi:N-acyl-D-amino-acid deacylase
VAHLGTAFLINQPHPTYLDEATARATLEIFDEARAEGVDVTFDVIAAASSISGQLPLINAFAKWVDPDLAPEALQERLNSEAFRSDVYDAYEAGRLKFAMIHTRVDPYWFDCFLIVNCSSKAYAGKTVEQIARETGREPLDAVMDILVEDPQTTWVQFRDKRMNDEAIAVFLNHPLGMPCTDTILVTSIEKAETANALGNYGMSPIMFGLYPHYLGHFVRERGDFSLEWAVKQATSVVADRFGIQGRGRLQAGQYADVVLFDMDTVGMCGDFHRPAQRPAGMSCVMVNGQVIYEAGEVTGALPGKVLRREEN